MKVNFLDMDSTPPIVKIMNYRILKKIGLLYDGKSLTKEEWKKVIKGSNSIILEHTASMAEYLKTNKSGDNVSGEEYTVVLAGKTFDELADIITSIQDNKYGIITVDASFLAKQIKDVFERRRKVDNFLYFISLIRTVDPQSDITVQIPDDNDTDMIERILSSGADKTEKLPEKEE